MARPQKIKIEAYRDQEFKNKAASPNEFELPVNPEQFSQRLQVKQDERRPGGAQGNDDRFLSTAPEELRLDFFLDGTGTIMGYVKPEKTVPQQLQELKDVVYTLSGDIHQPKFLKVVLGTDVAPFYCKLTDLQITYTLFDPDGMPLRAKISATFKGFTDPQFRVAKEKKSSPDLTHIRSVQAGDLFPLMVYRIYNDASLYLEVARANGLANFRRLKPGQEIFFPPVEKTSK
ncbi:MAG: LysM peptidoglycan-binding domain-containing protein [Phaeodactylibacter sp.]|nr:LysM peptidoglycan-binding domain-containing protein [Phaeodactylibacter sp.]MCB9301673.1 hypothetical protein [Lewinellaceae bacterium]